jgi:hypothetical protein
MRMSTRGWYEYYVVDALEREVSLAMQFYKWGDATPGNALAELGLLQEKTDLLGRHIPVGEVRTLLLDNLGSAYGSLPDSFLIGCYYFLLQRAEKEQSPFRRCRYAHLAEQKRPDYLLGYALGVAEAKQGFEHPHHDDPTIARVMSSIGVGTLLRRWRDHCARMTFLEWLQLITQVEEEVRMGSLAGPYTQPFDTSYVYRFFFHVPGIGLTRQLVGISP